MFSALKRIGRDILVLVNFTLLSNVILLSTIYMSVTFNVVGDPALQAGMILGYVFLVVLYAAWVSYTSHMFNEGCLSEMSFVRCMMLAAAAFLTAAGPLRSAKENDDDGPESFSSTEQSLFQYVYDNEVYAGFQLCGLILFAQLWVVIFSVSVKNFDESERNTSSWVEVCFYYALGTACVWFGVAGRVQRNEDHSMFDVFSFGLMFSCFFLYVNGLVLSDYRRLGIKTSGRVRVLVGFAIFIFSIYALCYVSLSDDFASVQAFVSLVVLMAWILLLSVSNMVQAMCYFGDSDDLRFSASEV